MELDEIIKKYNLKLLLTFGSYGTERFRPDSDIDVAYESDMKISVDMEIQLLSDLILYFKRDKIDLVNLKRVNPLLLYEVACNSKVLFDENGRFLKFKLKASSRYADTRFLREARKLWLNEQLVMQDTHDNIVQGGI